MLNSRKILHIFHIGGILGEKARTQVPVTPPTTTIIQPVLPVVPPPSKIKVIKKY